MDGEDMIPDRTVTIVAGDGGGGKRTLMLHLGVAIAGERPWLGHNPDPGRVLFVTAEDDGRITGAPTQSRRASMSSYPTSQTSISCRWPARTPLWGHRKAERLSLRRPPSSAGSSLSSSGSGRD